MHPFLFIHPATFQATLLAMLPWLASSVAIGAFAGYQRAENARQKRQLARQQAMIERLSATSAELRAHLATPSQVTKSKPTANDESGLHSHLTSFSQAVTTATPAIPRRVLPPGSTIKHSLFQSMIEDNLNLHREIKNTDADQSQPV